MRWLATRIGAVVFAVVTVALIATGTFRYANAQQTNTVSLNLSNTVSSIAYELNSAQEMRSLTATARITSANVEKNNWKVQTTSATNLLAFREGQMVTVFVANGQVIHFVVSEVFYQNTHKQITLEYEGATAPEGQPKASRQ